MRILLIGKNNILNWIQNISAETSLKHETETLFLNELAFTDQLKKVFFKGFSKKMMYNHIQSVIGKKIDKFNPDLVLFISPFMFNSLVFDIFDNYPKIVKFAWIGDRFSLEHKNIANKFDKLFVTDSSFIDDAKKFNFPRTEYLPLAVNGNLFFNKNIERKNSLVFIGSYTLKRAEFLNKVNNIDLEIIGPKWKDLDTGNKRIKYLNKTISIDEVANYYNKYKYILNIKHEHNVTNGLNMRTFEVMACGSCLLQDYVKDVDLNFEVGKEILVYNSLEELNELIEKLNNDMSFYNKIVQNGEKAVLQRHTYKNRINEILKGL